MRDMHAVPVSGENDTEPDKKARNRSMDLSRGWLPITLVASLLVVCVGGAAWTVNFFNEVNNNLKDMNAKLDILARDQASAVTEQRFENWILRFRWDNRGRLVDGKDLLVPDYK